VSWKTNTGPTDFLQWVASSADGSKLVAACDIGVYTSVDSGISWSPTILPYGQWKAAASSSDGSKLVVVGGSGGIYTSTNSGTNWSGGFNSDYWLYVASSANGSNLVVGAPGAATYISTNSGQSWLPTFFPGAYRAASSADGSRLFLVEFFGRIYTLDPGPPLRLEHSGGSMVLSIPNYALSSYALQQNDDLSTSSWSAVTNARTDTNGWFQYVLPPSGSNRFFRLDRYH
jgi:hypothetical protein